VPVPADLLPLFGKTLTGPFDLTINHWDPANIQITPEAREMTRCAVVWCVSEDVEIFTRRGWLQQHEVREGDQSLGINPVTGLSEWQVIEHIYRSGAACHEMVRLKCPGHQSLSTPDHRWLVRNLDGGLQWCQSADLRPGDSIPCSVPCADLPAEPKYSDAFVELVAWIYTEGWLERGRSIRLGQNDRVYPEKTQRIRAALYAMLGPPQAGKFDSCLRCGRSEPDSRGRITRARGLCHKCYEHQRTNGFLGQWSGYETWTESPRKPDGMVIFNISRPASQEILAVCPDKAPSHEFLLSLTRAQLELFIEVSIQADGTGCAQAGCSFSQALGSRMDAFVFACILAGKRPSRPRRSKEHPHLASVGLLRRPDARLSEAGCREVYEGIIWCPSVRHGNWLARSDGHIFYTGNTMWEFACGPAGKSGLIPHCRNRGTLRRRLGLFDLVLGYDQVTLGSLSPYIPRGVASGILQGGFDAGQWKKADRDWNAERFMFLMHGALNTRKAPWTAVQAYVELKHERPEFGAARFAIHTMAPGLFPEMNQIYEDMGLRVFMEAWDHETLEAFYAAGHCLLSPSRGEGKNLPALEMMATGGVVAAADYAGHTNWMSDAYAYPLAFELKPTFPKHPDAAHDARVSVEELKRVMWHVYTCRAEARQKGDLAARIIPSMCDWSVVVEDLFRRIRDLVPHNGQLVYDLAHACRRDPSRREGELRPG